MGEPNEPNEIHMATDRTQLNAAIDMVLRHDPNAAGCLLLKLRLLESNVQRKIRNKLKRGAAPREPNANGQIEAEVIQELRNEIGQHARQRELKQRIEELQAQVNDLRQRRDMPAKRQNDNLKDIDPIDPFGYL